MKRDAQSGGRTHKTLRSGDFESATPLRNTHPLGGGSELAARIPRQGRASLSPARPHKTRPFPLFHPSRVVKSAAPLHPPHPLEEPQMQATERILLDLCDKEQKLAAELKAVRREIGLALSAHRRAFPAVDARAVQERTGVNRTTIWEVEVGRAWRRSVIDKLPEIAATISELREEQLSGNPKLARELAVPV